MKKNYMFLIILMIVLTSISTTALVHATNSSVEKPTIIIGDDINYPPYSYIDDDGKPTGFNIELAEAVGTAMGYNVEIRLDEWDETRKALENDEIDGIAGMFYSVERAKIYDFTVKHSITNGDIFTNKSIRLEKIEDLRGRTIVIQRADIVGEYLKSLDLDIQFVEVATVGEALLLVNEGLYDYAGVLKLPGLYTAKEKSVTAIKSNNLILMPNDYCMAVKKGNESLLLSLNGGLKIVKANGEYQRIYDKWLSIYEEKTIADFLNTYYMIIVTIGLIVVGLIVVSLILKQLVNKKTKELQIANLSLVESKSEIEEKALVAIEMKEALRVQYDKLIDSENKLRISEERSQAILNALPDIVFVFNNEGRFTDYQVDDESKLFIPKEALIGKLLRETFPEIISTVAHEKLQRAITEDTVQQFEYELNTKNQKEIFEMRFIKSKKDEVIGISRDVTADRIYKERIEFLSYHDHLTGLYNRRFFEEELKRLDLQANFPLCIIMGDLNGLKLVNDSFGHQVGDQLLIRAAEVIKKACEEDEIIARIGGDEFVILIPQKKFNQPEQLINRIQKLAAAEKVGSINLSISFGWEVKDKVEDDIQDIFNRAEDYMYKKKLFEGPSMRGNTIGAIINTLNEKNKREELHSRRVSEISCLFGKALGFSDQGIDEIKTIGLLHDIGKIGINEELLNKPGKLLESEFEEIKRHPEIGYRILSMVNDMSDIANYILYHHERWDGKGYPRKLAGADIPLQSRIISIVDAYDAMTSERSYKIALSKEEAITELRESAGTQFDQDLIDTFTLEVLPLSQL